MSGHRILTLMRCYLQLGATQFESWEQLRAFKRRWERPLDNLKNLYCQGRIPTNLAARLRIRLYIKLAQEAIRVAEKTEWAWTLLEVS